MKTSGFHGFIILNRIKPGTWRGDKYPFNHSSFSDVNFMVLFLLNLFIFSYLECGKYVIFTTTMLIKLADKLILTS